LSTAPGDLLLALSDPGFFPDRPDVVERRETLISWVFLAGERAYKVKKPIVLPFVDYGSLERRREFCREEVRLNRRLAPEIYLGVRAIVVRDDRLVLAEDGDEQAVEYAVEMRRYADDWTLAARIEGDALAAGDLDELGARLAAFHNEATGMDPARVELEQLARPIQDTFESMRRWPDTVAPSRLMAGRRFVDSYLAGHRTKIEERVLADRVRDGHGDLRAEHVLFSPDGIEIVDCVEFDPALRQVDVAADLAFLVMDLTALGAPRAATRLVEAYRAGGGDAGDDDFLAFHAAARAWTRAKVALFRSETEDPDEAAASAAEARRLASLAERFAWRARAPLPLIVCGPPASGKSHLAASVAEASGLDVVSSDVTRKEAAGLRSTERAPQEVYSESVSLDTYRALGLRAAAVQRTDGGVIVDATFRRRAHREAFSDSYGSASAGVYVECRAHVLERRARRRQEAPQRVSDATPEIAVMLGHEFQPLDEIDADRHITLRTDRPVSETVADLVALLDERMARTSGAANAL
jgi:uncharacterized protein